MSAPSFPLFRLLVIAAAIFAAVSSQFLPLGLLPQMADDLGVSESRIGLLVTAFATAIVVCTIPLAALTRRYSRKWLMVTLLGIFAISNVLCAIAPGYEFLMGARILGGLAHGLFWTVTNPYAARLVPASQLSRAMSVTAAGGSAAFILGVPFTTFLGNAMGWRLAFAAMAVIIVVLAVFVVVYLPTVSHIVPLATGEIPIPVHRDRTMPGIVVVCIGVVIVFIGQNLFYTYITPWAIQVGDIGVDWVSSLLFGYGAAGAIGIALSGVLGDRFPRASVNVAIGGVVASFVFLAVAGTSPVPVVAGMLVWSVLFGGIPAIMASRLMHTASNRMRDLAAAALTTSYNLAAGIGSLAGGAVLDGVGISWLPSVAAAIIAVGLVFTMLTDRVWRAQTH